MLINSFNIVVEIHQKKNTDSRKLSKMMSPSCRALSTLLLISYLLTPFPDKQSYRRLLGVLEYRETEDVYV